MTASSRYFSGTSRNNSPAALSQKHAPSLMNPITFKCSFTEKSTFLLCLAHITNPGSDLTAENWKCLWSALLCSVLVWFPYRNLQDTDPFWASRALTLIHHVLLEMFQALFSSPARLLRTFPGKPSRAFNPWIKTVLWLHSRQRQGQNM